MGKIKGKSMIQKNFRLDLVKLLDGVQRIILKYFQGAHGQKEFSPQTTQKTKWKLILVILCVRRKNVASEVLFI